MLFTLAVPLFSLHEDKTMKHRLSEILCLLFVTISIVFFVLVKVTELRAPTL